MSVEGVHHPERGDDRVDVVREAMAVQPDLDPVLAHDAALLARVAGVRGAAGVAAHGQGAPVVYGQIACLLLRRLFFESPNSITWNVHMYEKLYQRKEQKLRKG